LPTYTFLDINTNELIEESMKISELDEFKLKNPHLQQRIVRPPSIGDSVRLGLRKPDASFRDVLKNVKHHHGGSRSIKNTINDF
jgi:hypothetical protein